MPTGWVMVAPECGESNIRLVQENADTPIGWFDGIGHGTRRGRAFASRQLADLGARVIKLERLPDGDFARGYDDKVHGESSFLSGPIGESKAWPQISRPPKGSISSGKYWKTPIS
jgi:hypothetical protein